MMVGEHYFIELSERTSRSVVEQMITILKNPDLQVSIVQLSGFDDSKINSGKLYFSIQSKRGESLLPTTNSRIFGVGDDVSVSNSAQK